MSDFDEEGSVLKDIEKGYRFRWQFQILLIGILMGVLTILLIELQRWEIITIETQGINIGFITSALILVWVLSFMWPVIIKVRNRLYNSVSMGLFFASISIFITFLVYINTFIGWVVPSTPLLLISFCLGIGTQLFEHLNPKILKNDWLGYLVIGVVSTVFAICTIIFLVALMQIPGIYIGIILTALFVWSLIPEEPY
jgi:hypothetical protein